MARPNKLSELRTKLLPVLADSFGKFGYSRLTTREIAKKCGVQQVILYRLWPGGKKEMFLAAIDSVWKQHKSDWTQVKQNDVWNLLELEAKVQGSRGLFKIVFQGLAEADDPDVRRVLSRMYRSYAEFVKSVIKSSTDQCESDAEVTAWSLLGLGTISRIAQLLGIKEIDRPAILLNSGRKLLE
jgi:AcrR family transcriptional regulator